MCDKMAISAYILKIVEKDPFLRLQMSAKEMFKSFDDLFTTFSQTPTLIVQRNPTFALAYEFYLNQHQFNSVQFIHLFLIIPKIQYS